MKKVLEFNVMGMNHDTDSIIVKITKQSHRCEEFGGISLDKMGSFVSDNLQVALLSNNYPEHRKHYGKIFYVQGNDNSKDDRTFEISLSIFPDFVTAVKEYNNFDFEEVKPTLEQIKMAFMNGSTYSTLQREGIDFPYIKLSLAYNKRTLPLAGEYYITNDFDRVIMASFNHSILEGSKLSWVIKVDVESEQDIELIKLNNEIAELSGKVKKYFMKYPALTIFNIVKQYVNTGR